jgi:hypothetical protein
MYFDPLLASYKIFIFNKSLFLQVHQSPKNTIPIPQSRMIKPAIA